MNSFSGANAGATTLLILARFFLNKNHICIFISEYLLFKNDMLVYRLTIHQQKRCLYLGGRSEREEQVWFSVPFKIRNGTFFKTKDLLNVFWVLHTSMFNYYWQIVYCDLSVVDEFVRNGDFRVYCTVYEYPQITCCYLIGFGHYSYVFLFLFILYHSFKNLIMVCCAWYLTIFNNGTSFYEAKKQQNVMTF